MTQPLSSLDQESFAPLKIWAVVLVRAGSKRLPQKAMRPLLGQPMVSWYLKALSEAQGFERRFLFTDDPDVLDCTTLQHPAIEIPSFLRPSQTSTDNTSSFDTLRYFLKQWDPALLPPWVMLGQCTSPLVDAKDFEKALALLASQDQAQGLLSVCAPAKPLTWLLTAQAHASGLQHVQPHPVAKSMGQDYLPNGAFYILRTQALLETKGPFSLWDHSPILPYVMPYARSIDIDTPEDFQVAEALLQTQRQISPMPEASYSIQSNLAPLRPRLQVSPPASSCL